MTNDDRVIFVRVELLESRTTRATIEQPERLPPFAVGPLERAVEATFDVVAAIPEPPADEPSPPDAEPSA